MTRLEIDAAVAVATSECIDLIHDRGFGIADPLDVDFDPEPCSPLAIDCDSMLPVN